MTFTVTKGAHFERSSLEVVLKAAELLALREVANKQHDVAIETPIR